MSYLKIGKYKCSDYDNNPTYQIAEVLDSCYEDITSIKLWFSFEELKVDYLYARDRVMEYVVSIGGFSALTTDYDRKMVSQNFCVSKTDRDTVYSDTLQEKYWGEFVDASEKCRTQRWKLAKKYASYRLTPTDSTDLAEETRVLNEKYIEYGIESLAVDGKDGIYDWVKGEGNYTTNGFPSKTYYTVEIKDGIINILNGIYQDNYLKI